MKKLISVALFALIGAGVANHSWCADVELPTQDQVDEFVRVAKNSDHGMKFDAAGINGDDRWQLLNARAAAARLAYASGMGTRGAYEFVGQPSWNMPVEDQVAHIRAKVLESGLVASLEDLMAIEALEDLDTDSRGYKKAHKAVQYSREMERWGNQRDRRLRELETAMHEAYGRGNMDESNNIRQEMKMLSESKFPGVL